MPRAVLGELVDRPGTPPRRRGAAASMGAVTTAADAAPAAPARPVGRLANLGNVLLALLAHFAVGGAWALTAVAVMGSLDVVRRMAMNSEFAWDTGRLPQPWVIPIGLVAAGLAHVFFVWAMKRAGRGRAAYSDVVVAICGVLVGVLLGAYLWTPPLVLGAKVGPASGQYAPWGLLGWGAYYARLALPGLIGLVAIVLVLFSRHSPLVFVVKWLAGLLRGRRSAPRRARV